MNKFKRNKLLFPVLAIAAFLAVVFAYRYAGRGTSGVPDIAPLAPAVMPVQTKKIVHRQTAVKKAEAPGTSGKRRKKRVSRLLEPGEALGGGNAARAETIPGAGK